MGPRRRAMARIASSNRSASMAGAISASAASSASNSASSSGACAKRRSAPKEYSTPSLASAWARMLLARRKPCTRFVAVLGVEEGLERSRAADEQREVVRVRHGERGVDDVVADAAVTEVDLEAVVDEGEEVEAKPRSISAGLETDRPRHPVAPYSPHPSWACAGRECRLPVVGSAEQQCHHRQRSCFHCTLTSFAMSPDALLDFGRDRVNIIRRFGDGPNEAITDLVCSRLAEPREVQPEALHSNYYPHHDRLRPGVGRYGIAWLPVGSFSPIAQEPDTSVIELVR